MISWLVDHLPFGLWRAGNVYLGMRLHFCSEDERTIEWNGKVIARGREPFDYERWHRENP